MKCGFCYIKWVIEVLGPVILGSKPCEILNISKNDCLKQNKINQINDFFESCTKVSYQIITLEDKSIRILFYNKNSLEEIFKNKRCVNFLKFLGYPNYTNVCEYIEILVYKLYSNEFPHEIGIFLGYPLKDVIGFMGYSNYEFIETKAWRIYGNPEDSYKTYDKFLSDRNKMKNILEISSINELKNVI